MTAPISVSRYLERLQPRWRSPEMRAMCVGVLIRATGRGKAWAEREVDTPDFIEMAEQKMAAVFNDGIEKSAPVDPRDPDPSREGVFRDHNCWRCHHGEKACVRGNPRMCENLHARND